MTSDSTRPSKLSSVGNTLTLAGMGALCLGWRGSALTLFGTGYRLLERDWRHRHPHFAGSFADRLRHTLAFYRQRHENPTNRRLHQLGVPLILGGAAGLCLSTPLSGPLWALSFGSFASGWVCNLVGHSLYEGNTPAFGEDPLAFVAGPVWAVQELGEQLRSWRTATR